MQPAMPLTRDIVLVGGGHAHALVLRRWGMDPLPGARLTVINPGPTAPYTGMLPGYVAGHYSRAELDIDLVRLARFAGARFIDGEATALDPAGGTVSVTGGRVIGFDVASLDIGIHSRMPSIPGFDAHGTPAKPLQRFADGWRDHLASASGGGAGDAVVIGGGVAGAELAMAMAHALRRRNLPAKVTVLEREGRLTGVSPRARAMLERALRRQGVSLRTGVTVARILANRVELAGGETIPAGFVAGAAGARPHAWLAETGLPLQGGFVCVERDLSVQGFDTIFAAGDCAHLVHAPRPKAGVYAVRAAPVLARNLRAACGEGRRARFRPQRNYLKLISLGGKRALAEKWGHAAAGGPLWWWKDRIDRAFMRKLSDLPAMAAPDLPPRIAADLDAGGGVLPLCGGCGAKVGPGILRQALAALPPAARDDVLSRPGDDAAVLAHGRGRQVVTVDHLRAFVEDPAVMTRIAAVHALGDVWAMGAMPQAALATIILPRMSDRLQQRTLAEITAAAAEVLSAAGADLVGGHTTMGAEMTVGFTLTGLHAGEPIGHAGARPGDAILLSRPIGSGTILAAEMAGRASGHDVMAALRMMATPQGDAARILCGAHAMTDVTGFGLAGHLGAICAASGTGAAIRLESVPIMAGALDLAAAGVRSAIHHANAAAAPVEGATGPRAVLLHDPQTSGGLLASVAPEAADALVRRLREAGHDAARIGEMEARPGLRCR